MTNYGKELLLDLHNCDPSTFNRVSIQTFLEELCNLINMEREDLHWWDDLEVPIGKQETEPHLKGTTAVQFIRTSNIVIHTLNLLEVVYINVFSCREFDSNTISTFSANWFKGGIVHSQLVTRE